MFFLSETLLGKMAGHPLADSTPHALAAAHGNWVGITHSDGDSTDDSSQVALDELGCR